MSRRRRLQNRHLSSRLQRPPKTNSSVTLDGTRTDDWVWRAGREYKLRLGGLAGGLLLSKKGPATLKCRFVATDRSETPSARAGTVVAQADRWASERASTRPVLATALTLRYRGGAGTKMAVSNPKPGRLAEPGQVRRSRAAQYHPAGHTRAAVVTGIELGYRPADYRHGRQLGDRLASPRLLEGAVGLGAWDNAPVKDHRP